MDDTLQEVLGAAARAGAPYSIRVGSALKKRVWSVLSTHGPSAREYSVWHSTSGFLGPACGASRSGRPPDSRTAAARGYGSACTRRIAQRDISGSSAAGFWRTAQNCVVEVMTHMSHVHEILLYPLSSILSPLSSLLSPLSSLQATAR